MRAILVCLNLFIWLVRMTIECVALQFLMSPIASKDNNSARRGSLAGRGTVSNAARGALPASGQEQVSKLRVLIRVACANRAR